MLWWGRFDPNYSRNRILCNLMRKNGLEIREFRPKSSFFGSVESIVFNPGPADGIWVPSFRHRDFFSARRYADKIGCKLVFDPLISSWDKVVFERKKYSADHRKARNLLEWEQRLYSRADIVIADTDAHRTFFQTVLNSPADKTFIIPVGADEQIFTPQPVRRLSTPPEILFFGSFIGLQGPLTIVEAAKHVPQAQWTMVGDGPLRGVCESEAEGIDNLRFEDWAPYESLPEKIAKADIVLGIFGDSDKAGRVIPNKVYQALACGRPVVTRSSDAYSASQHDSAPGLAFVPPMDPSALAECIQQILSEPLCFEDRQLDARNIYETHFSEAAIDSALKIVLDALGL